MGTSVFLEISCLPENGVPAAYKVLSLYMIAGLSSFKIKASLNSSNHRFVWVDFPVPDGALNKYAWLSFTTQDEWSNIPLCLRIWR